MTKRLKIAHVVLALGVGGMEKVIVDIISRLDQEAFESRVYCVSRKGALSKYLEQRGINTVLVRGASFPFHLPFILAGMFKKDGIDIVHSYSGVYRDAALAGFIAKTAVVMHTDQGKFYPDSLKTRLNHRVFSMFRDKVTAVSEELRDFLIKEVGIPSKKVVRIYNGVDVKDHDISVDQAAKKKELGLSSDARVIGIVARLVPVKDHATLFRAFKKIREKTDNVKLLVVGDGQLRDVLKRLAEELGQAGDIIFAGNRSDVRELLYVMDIVCLSSLSEGLSLTLAEAMASKRAVVATGVGGNNELIESGKNGILVPPSDSDAMAEAIESLLGDNNKRASMGRMARIRIEEGFDINNIVDEYENLYFDLAKQKGLA